MTSVNSTEVDIVEVNLTPEEYLKSYQEWQDSTIWKTVRGDEQWAIIALSSEVGELCQMLEKATRKGNKYTKEQIMDELGDVMWNVSNIANLYGFTLDEMMVYNVDKITKRQRRESETTS